MSTIPLSGVNSSFFSAIPLSRFSLKMYRFFLHIWSWKKCALCTLLSVKSNSDDSATSFLSWAKLIRSAKLLNCVFCLFVKLRLSLGRIGTRDKDIPDCRNSGKIHVPSRRWTEAPDAPPWWWKKHNSRFLRFFVRSVPLFRSLMLTPM